jgi:hypothetical protein
VKSVQSIQKKRPGSGLAGSGLFFWRLNAKARLLPGFVFSFWFYFIKANVTKLPLWAGLFSAVRDLFCVGCGFPGVTWGLDTRVCWCFCG